MSIANENFATGGTGGAIFGGPHGAVPSKAPGPQAQPIGDEYDAPKGLPGWKQPSYDEDDRVDPDKYPEPKSGPVNTFLGRFFPDPKQQGLAVAKVFYFFFFAAFGSLFPLMAVYFKQLGMDAAQTGFLSGVRPIIEYLAIPFWNKIADRFQKGKIMLLVSLASWILFTQPIGHIHPPVVSCKYYNGSKVMLKLPNTYERRKRSIPDFDPQLPFSGPLTDDNLEELPRALPVQLDPALTMPLDTRYVHQSRVKRSDPEWKEGHVIGQSPQIIDFKVYQGHESHHKVWVSPAWNNEVFERAGVHKVFFLILLLVIIGEFFSSPAVALVDSAVITLLGEENTDKYGSQRMFGSIGWGVTMFIMGMVLDHSKIFQNARCDMNQSQRNYNICFSVFSSLMFCALLVATQLPFKYGGPPTANNVPMNNIQNGQQGPQKKKDEDAKAKLKKAKVFAQQLRAMPEFVAVFKALTNLRLLMCMLVAWVMGMGIGLIFTFLFWHLQDIGGSPTLFGIASVINHVSEMAAYFYSFKIINKVGHVKVLAAGLLCNVLRFLYISFISWPWLVLPFEFVQGITHAAVWAALCSFIAHNTDAELRPSAQGFLQGSYHGFGRFCGAVFGGMLIKEYGTVLVFRVYGVVCAVFLVLFVLVNIYNRNEGGSSSDDVDPRTLAEESAHMAPHGVPGAPMPRVLSNTRLEEQQTEQQQEVYGANLDLPGGGANNPFLQDAAGDQYNYTAGGSRIAGAAQNQGQYYGAGYSQAQSGYSSSGFGLQ